MVKIVETDERITLEKQLDEDVGPIVVMNKFNVDPQEVDEFLQVFARTTEKFKQQPGFISAQLHQGIAGSTTFVNYVIWESAAHFNTLVMTGTDDNMYQPHVNSLKSAEKIPGAWLVQIKDAGHAIVDQYPAEVGEIFNTFLTTVPNN